MGVTYESCCYSNFNIFRCKCGNCQMMATPRECICCLHTATIRAPVKDRVGTYKCITAHPGFEVNCLNEFVMEHAVKEWRAKNGPIGDEEPAHEYVFINIKSVKLITILLSDLDICWQRESETANPMQTCIS